MLALGAAIALASIPGWTSVSLPAGWAALSILLPTTLWRPARLTGLHLLFLAILAWATLSLLWTPDVSDGLYRLWELSLLYLTFRLGLTLTDISPLVRGLAYGCLVSSAVALVQWLGYSPILGFSSATPAGLFFNPAIAGQTTALVAVACLAFNRWTLAIALIPGIYLSGSRGGMLVLAVGFVLNLVRDWRLLLFAIAGCLGAVLASAHDIERIAIWRAALHFLDPFGNGAGSFISIYFTSADRLIHPVDAHNDLLQIVFELGIPGAIGFVGILACALRRTNRPEWPIIASFVFLSFFAFPLFVPISGFLLALSAGRVAGCGNWSWSRITDSGRNVLSRNSLWATKSGGASSEAIPALTRTS